jgi:hypothetical protein
VSAKPVDFGTLHLDGGDDGDYTKCAGWTYGPAPAGANVADDSTTDGSPNPPNFWTHHNLSFIIAEGAASVGDQMQLKITTLPITDDRPFFHIATRS